MTTHSAAKTTPQTRNAVWLFIDRIPGTQFFKNLNIGVRLIIGFGLLVALTLLGAGFSYVGSVAATKTINNTTEVRVPTALVSAQARADLLRMLGDVRGYLALGDQEFRDSYNQARADFEDDLARLKVLKSDLSAESQARLDNLDTVYYEEWKPLPDQLFELRDDQLDREPAYRLLATEGSRQGGQILIDVQNLIDTQGQRDPTTRNMELLQDLANFQGSFAGMMSGLRGYVTTRNRIYRQEYDVNLTINEEHWSRLLRLRNSFDSNQQQLLDNIDQNRNEFLLLPDQIFERLESDRWREDLYLFRTEGLRLTEQMQDLLAKLTVDQQVSLQTELNRGKNGLERANNQILAGGAIALLLGVALTLIFRGNIAGPIVRLTGVAERIRGGDLETQAAVESRDEIGTLAQTFNNMTTQLRQTLRQVRKEKKRADDLLEVVIPIGVDLSAEKDFNRLLENMLMEAKSFCRANAGILLLHNTQERNLRFEIVRDNAQNLALGGTTGQKVPFSPLPLYKNDEPNQRNVAAHVALNGVSVNIPDTGEAEAFDFSDQKNGNMEINYHTATSMLSIPLKNSDDQILGVLQLLDAKDPETGQIIPFDPNLQQLMESFSSLAAAALEAYIREQGLRREIQQLRIEIDEAKRQQEVTEIIETDFFQDLQAKARTIRERGRRSKRDQSDPGPSDS